MSTICADKLCGTWACVAHVALNGIGTVALYGFGAIAGLFVLAMLIAIAAD